VASGVFARPRAVKGPRGLGRAIVVLASLPAAWALLALASDVLRRTRFLGSNPVKEAEHFLGEWALRLLVATLCVTPLRQSLGWHWLARHRRTLGLLAFAYAVLHWLVYALLDVQLDWRELLRDLAKRPYVMVGMAGLALLLPLALTSTRAMIRRLGGRRWGALHRLVYVIAVLGVVHFWMSVKADITRPLLYALAFSALFGYRAWRWLARGRVAPS
jgi:methionine sulfoxide reductase heme-binding subunit